MTSKSSDSSLINLTILKPFFIVASLVAIRQFIDPIYCDPQCAIRLVNESDPKAFSVHPYWKDLTYDDSCAGDKLEQYRQGQFSVFEGTVQTIMTNIWNAIAVFGLVYQIYQALGKVSFFNAVRYTVMSFIIGFFSGTLMMMHTHFEQDVSFLTGAIIHHAEESSPGINLEKATISQGYVICGFVNRFFYSFMIYQFITRSKRLSRFNPIVIVALLNLMVWYAVSTVKHKHPWYHLVATPEMKYSMPYSQEWRAYKHVIIHHDTGESFSGDYFFDFVFDYQLYAFGYLHNKIFNIELGSPAHHLFNCVFDAGSGVISSAIIYALLHAGAFLLPQTSTKTKAN